MTPPIYTITLNPGLDRTLFVPQLHENAVLRATTSRLDWGGKGFNVSRALQALGVQSVAMGLVGGFTGKMLSQGLKDLSIATDFVEIAGETRTNTVIEEAGSGRYFKVNEAGPTIEAEALEELSARILARVTPDSYWALCGSLPPGVPTDFYACLIATIQAKGGKVALDASGEALRQGVRAAPFLIKPNREEASEFTGIFIHDQTTAQQAAQHFLAQGAQMVALSLGEKGLLLATNEQNIHLCAPKVAVQTLVGVGDALLAGILYALVNDHPMADVARWGVGTGTAAAMTAGVGVATMTAILEMVAQIDQLPLQ